MTRLAENAGHLAIWRHNLLDRLGIHTEYVYTDPDVVPIEACPRDLVGMLQSILDDNPTIATAGVCLRLDDLPDTYRYKAQAIAWEQQFWLNPAAPGLFHAPIDTTLALYRPQAGHSHGLPTIRTGWPYLAAHEGWYLNHLRPSEEDLFYQSAVAAGTSHWSTAAVPAWLETAAMVQASRQPSLLHVGRGGVGLPGYRHVADDGPVPLPERAVDGIYVDGTLDRLTEDPTLAQELHRVVKPGAAMVLHPRLVTARQIVDLLLHPSHWARGWRLNRVTLALNLDVGPYDGDRLRALVCRRPSLVRRVMAQLRAVTTDELQLVLPTIAVGDMDGWSGFTLLPSGV